jgi:hypothetical protein
MKYFRIVAFVTMLLPVTGYTHHSFSTEYDADGYITLQGTISEVRFRNPHVQYFLDVAENGETVRWNLAGQNVAALRRRGVTADSVVVGDEVTVSGYPGRNSAKKLYLDALTTADGVEIPVFGSETKLPSSVAATEAVELDSSSIVDGLIGHWAFDVDKRLPGAPFHLQFIRSGDEINAVLDNEELEVIVGIDRFTIVLDRENLAGFPATLQLDGGLSGGDLAGTVAMTSGYTNYSNLHAETFTAVRSAAADWQPVAPAQMQPVDLSGVWSRKIGLGPVGRTNPHLNEAGEARYLDYKKGLYDPTLRCLPSGPMRKYAQPGNVEILATTNRLTMLYGNGKAVRRLWFDRDSHTQDRPHDELGESLASWDGSTLVIDTRALTENVLTHNSEPISEHARVIERYWLDDDGNLVMEATLHDPTYYARPVVRRVLMVPSDDTELVSPPCDPDSFYRSMQFEGTLDSYYENQPEVTSPR